MILYVFIYRIYRIVNSYTVGYTSFLWCQNNWRHMSFFCLTYFVCRVVGWQRAVMWLGSGNRSVYQQATSRKPKNCKTKSSDIFSLEISTFHKSNSKDNRIKKYNNMGMDQYLLIPFLVGWTSIYQLFWCSPGVQGFDTLPYQQHTKTHIIKHLRIRIRAGGMQLPTRPSPWGRDSGQMARTNGWFLVVNRC